MLYQTLRNGEKLPLIGLGTYQTAGDETYNSVRWAIDLGYTLIDTAQIYKNEDIVGKAVKDSGKTRTDMFIVTKVNFKNYPRCYDSVLRSMKDLKTDYLDLVLLHWPYNDYYAAWRDLEKLYKEGVVRSIGVSNFHADRLIDLINYNEIVPFVDQIETNLLCQQKKNAEYMKRYSVAHMAYTPLGQNRRNEMFDLAHVTELSEKYGKSKCQIMLRSLVQRGVTAIPNSVHKERIAENIDIFGFSLTEAEMEALAALDTATALVGTPEDPERVIRSINW